MENAGRSCVSRLMERGARAVVVACGKGNNAGDGFVIARRLAVEGVNVKILMCADPAELKGDALQNYKIAHSLDLNFEMINTAMPMDKITDDLSRVDGESVDWIVDCLLGTGASGDPREPFDKVIEASNKIDCKRMAVDIPSGLDCDTGAAGEPTFIAELTVTFVAKKIGFKNPEAAAYLGETQSVTISVPEEIVLQVLESGS